ncbi:MAG: hypothetical protein MRZ79_07550 [Bacteroidia bacterium]|nr:hypothetical protein [Bacteroidia bacterium]
MDWINDIKDKFSRKRIRSLDRTKEYNRDFVDIDSARKIGMILNLSTTDPGDISLVEDYMEALKKRSKDILLIEINLDKKSEPTYSNIPNSIFINPTKLNWLDYPIPSLENQIRSHELDILMDFDMSTRMPSKYICSMARAKTRTGLHREGFEVCYELMIDPTESNDMKNMIKEFDYFLNMIDNGKRVKV